jgi:hypothetical protein
VRGGSRISPRAPVFESVVGSTMRPGDRGTAKLLRDWGDRLVTVRYRYSNSPPTRFTTIELVVASATWTPTASRSVIVEVRSWEGELREKIRAAGGRFVLKAMRWRIRYDKAIALGLKDRVSFLVPHASPTPRFSTHAGTRKSPSAQTSTRLKGKSA